MNLIKYFFLLLGSVWLLQACSGEGDKSNDQQLATTPSVPEGLDRNTELRFKQYWVQGRALYKENCMGCHLNDGNGMAQLIPPLAGADFLKDEAAVICVIRHGQQGPVQVNGVEFNGNMPANPQLRPLEIAEIATYILNSWGNKGSFVTVQDVEKALEICQQN